jgi:nitroimidazol reductase NimA-like FMN-containing flavoprotein (pyridoxamine 5'-phosphate oxidase superfamily)
MEKERKADRPFMPGYGISEASEGILPWSWAEERLSNSRNYYLATTRPEGRPHVMAVWGVWFGGRYYFSTGEGSRKARNLTTNPECVVTTDVLTEAVILEGRVKKATGRKTLQSSRESTSRSTTGR